MATTNPFLLKPLFSWVPFFSIGLTVFLVALVGLFGIFQDLKSIRRNIYRTEIGQAQSHADRTVGRIESDLLKGLPLSSYRKEADSRWLEDYWRQTIPGKPERLYAAIVDNANAILAHSDNLDKEIGEITFLESDWDRIQIEDYGLNVHEITGTALSRKIRAIDISSPITLHGKVVGSYHTGLESSWLESRCRDEQAKSIQGWGIVLGTIGTIVLISSILLFRLGMHTRRLEVALDQAETRRLADLSRLIVGMAHELRNPLNAVRLNLFTTEKIFAGQAYLPSEEAVSMIHESVTEVERMEELIGQLLGYARADIRKQGECNLDHEVKSILQFLKQIHERHAIDICYTHPIPNVWIRMDAKHFRQVLLNILNNAREAIGNKGRIEIDIGTSSGRAEIRIQDSGMGIPVDHVQRIFEPFFSTRDDGVGMGLAVVNSLVESAGGTITCERSTTMTGMNFLISLPCFSKESPSERG